MTKDPRIVFFGTPEFAVASLEAIVKAGFIVAGVVTAPDRPAGRGLRMMQSAVKEYALKEGLTLLQPSNLKDQLFHEALRSLRPDLQVVVAFRMLPEEVWQLPPLGTFNLHASLLPKFRGAAPINWAIMQGETETGVTTFLLEQKVDTGNILFSEKLPVYPDETAGELHDRLMVTGSALVVKTIRALVDGTAHPVPQPSGIDPNNPAYRAPKLHKEDGRIDPGNDLTGVYRQIRGLSPYPGAYIEVKGKDGNLLLIKIFKAVPEFITHTDAIGQWSTDGRSDLKISFPDGYLHITKLQLAGRKAMEIGEFLRGFGKYFT